MKLHIPVENIDDVIADYDSIQVYSDSSPTGDFSALVTTIPLDADTTLYTYDDVVGAAWYRHRFFNSSTSATSDYSPPWRVRGYTLADLRIEMAEQKGTGFRGTCSSAGTTTSLIDAALGDSGVSSSFLEGAWVYRPDASADDKLRRIKSFTVASQAIVPTRDWGSAPTDGEAYQVFLLLPPVDAPGVPGSYDRAIRLGLGRAWFEDEFIVGTGTTDGKTRFDVSAFMPHVLKTHEVLYRRFDENTGYARDRDAGKNGGFWYFVQTGRGGQQLELVNAPGKSETVVCRAFRSQDPVYRDNDVIDCPNALAVAAAGFGLFVLMTQIRPGKYTGELAEAEAAFLYEATQYVPTSVVIGG